MRPRRRTRLEAAAEALVAERQAFQERLIRLSEYATSRPMTDYQVGIVREQVHRLDALGVSLVPALDGPPRLRASHVVGVARVSVGRKDLIIQVEPRIGNANFLRMLDHTAGQARTSDQEAPVATEAASPASLLLSFFADQVHQFLLRHSYRGYSFATENRPGAVKGRPLVQEYATKSLPRSLPHVLPCRYLRFSPEVIENQIIAYALYIAAQLASFFSFARSADILRRLAVCNRLLPGVSVRRVTLAEIDAIRYTRLNQHFEPIHRLCAAVIGGYSLSLRPGERVPFVSFAVDMAQLFEDYVRAVLAAAFGSSFNPRQSDLRFGLGAYGKSIILDGLLSRSDGKVVVECKYRGVSSTADADDLQDPGEQPDLAIVPGQIKGRDLYQSVSYATHVAIRANAAVLAYPVFSETAPPIKLWEPIRVFGWRANSVSGIPVYPLGLNLASRFGDLASAAQSAAQGII